MIFMKLLVIVLCFWNTFCEEEIFLSRALFNAEPRCKTSDGKSGICRPLVQCATYFVEIAQLSRSPCQISNGKKGVCCPKKQQQNKYPTKIVQNYVEQNYNVGVPISSQELNHACENGMKKFRKRSIFVQNLLDRNIIAPKNSAVYWHSRLFETTDEIFKKGQDATIVLEASKDLMSSLKLNKEQAEESLSNFDVKETSIRDTCPPSSRCTDSNSRYRTMDGSCNNIQNPDWGKTGITFARMIPSEYNDGISTFRQSVSKKPLPSPRFVSTSNSPSISDIYANLTILIWQWGQFVDHDLTHTPISKGANMADISCCIDGKIRQGGDLHPECMPIDIPENDKFFSQFNQRCMEFVRSMPAIRPECKFGPREQMNQITSYLDASNVYGSTDDEAVELREFRGGLMRVTMHLNRELLPGRRSHAGCVIGDAALKCFIAGDTRVNEQPDLAVIHLVWMRQHNNIARGLAKINPGWSDEVLYQEARRIVGAQMQHITYNEYLPIVLGREFIERFDLVPLKSGYFTGYRRNVDATIVNAFAAAAFRYGHTLVTDHLFGFSKFGDMNENMELSRFQFKPFNLYVPGVIDAMIRGLSAQQSERFDRFVSEQLTNKLLAQDRPFGMDLVALNLQRGRDHGIPPYTKWRSVCDLSPVNKWTDLYREMDSEAVDELRIIYESVDDIDLFIGGISERILSGSLLGPTFLCIIGRQFIKLKIGDRFYYENGNLGGSHSPFTENQLQEIRKSSLARILCDNSDGVEVMQPLVFGVARLANQRADCKSDSIIPKLSLEPWRNSVAVAKKVAKKTFIINK